MQGINIRWGDLLTYKADCVVVSAGPEFRHEAGMSRQLYQKIGEEAWSGLDELVTNVDPGDVIVTPAFGLDARYLFHAISPVWDGGEGEAAALLYATASLCFSLAKDHGCHEMAMPVLSAGKKGFPKRRAWDAILRALLDFFETEPDYDLEVTFLTLHPGIRAVGQKVLETQTGFRFRGVKS